MTARRLVYALALAASAALVAVPVVLAQDDHEPDARPVAEETPMTTQPDVGADWKITSRLVSDIDGDGVDDIVLLRRRGGQLGDGPWRLEVAPSVSDRPAHALIDDTSLSVALGGLADLDGGPPLEVVLSHEQLTFDSGPGVVAYRLHAGTLVPVEPSGSAPLAEGYGPDMRDHEWWIEDGQLMSSRSRVRFRIDDGGHRVFGPKRYLVDVWDWSLRKGRLVPRSLGETRCVDDREGSRQTHPEPCPPRDDQTRLRESVAGPSGWGRAGGSTSTAVVSTQSRWWAHGRRGSARARSRWRSS